MSEVHHDVIGPDEPDRRSGRWLHLSAWVVALVVFEVTADPSLVVVVGCSKFGWAQLRAARWLRRNDPNTRRGKACRWFYVSWGLWVGQGGGGAAPEEQVQEELRGGTGRATQQDRAGGAVGDGRGVERGRR